MHYCPIHHVCFRLLFSFLYQVRRLWPVRLFLMGLLPQSLAIVLRHGWTSICKARPSMCSVLMKVSPLWPSQLSQWTCRKTTFSFRTHRSGAQCRSKNKCRTNTRPWPWMRRRMPDYWLHTREYSTYRDGKVRFSCSWISSKSPYRAALHQRHTYSPWRTEFGKRWVQGWDDEHMSEDLRVRSPWQRNKESMHQGWSSCNAVHGPQACG